LSWRASSRKWEYARRKLADQMDWNCTSTEEKLTDFLEGTLTAEESAAFSSHAAQCAKCAQTLALVSALVSRMRLAEPIEPPPFLARKIIVATLGAQASKERSGEKFGWLRAIWQPRFAMGLATVAASAMIVVHGAGMKSGKSPLNPVNIFHGANRQLHLTYARSAKFVNDLRVVYEIQSRLSSQPERISEPVAPPENTPGGGPQTRPPASEDKPQQKPVPHTGRRQYPEDSSEFARLLDDFSQQGVLRRRS
jgi:hypothetical protein